MPVGGVVAGRDVPADDGEAADVEQLDRLSQSCFPAARVWKNPRADHKLLAPRSGKPAHEKGPAIEGGRGGTSLRGYRRPEPAVSQFRRFRQSRPTVARVHGEDEDVVLFDLQFLLGRLRLATTVDQPLGHDVPLVTPPPLEPPLPEPTGGAYLVYQSSLLAPQEYTIICEPVELPLALFIQPPLVVLTSLLSFHLQVV